VTLKVACTVCPEATLGQVVGDVAVDDRHGYAALQADGGFQ
jgi:hypothetical protein